MGLPVKEEFCTWCVFIYQLWYCFAFRDSLTFFI